MVVMTITEVSMVSTRTNSWFTVKCSYCGKELRRRRSQYNKGLPSHFFCNASHGHAFKRSSKVLICEELIDSIEQDDLRGIKDTEVAEFYGLGVAMSAIILAKIRKGRALGDPKYKYTSLVHFRKTTPCDSRVE